RLPRSGVLLPQDPVCIPRYSSMNHFYFHLVTAYDVLRHSGVNIGKRDYLGPYPIAEKPSH
ncbi:DUF1993 family protein, partial [Bordetella holmesii]